MTKDLAGQRFGKLVIVRRTTPNAHGAYRWECKCDCGGVKEVLISNLRNGNTKSCGCVGKPHKDHAGTRFGRLVVVKSVKSSSKDRWWECVCDCGGIKVARMGSLKRGNTLSCGCLSKETAAEKGRKSKKHGLAGTPEYAAWHAMMLRCTDERNSAFRDYGGRGIMVCREWFDVEQFVVDMGRRPSKDHQIDRRDNSKGYSKENCRWATRVQNQRNRRCNQNVMLDGLEMTVAEAAEKTGLNYTTIYFRSRERGLTQNTGLFRPVEQSSIST